MKIGKLGSGRFSVEIGRDELVTISNCINDAVDLMGDGEFHARVGVTREEALQLLKQIGSALE